VANHKQALKRHRQSLKRNLRNKHFKTIMKNAVKKALAAKESDNEEEKKAAFRQAESVIRRVSSKGLLPGKRASRKVSRLSKQLQVN